MFNLNCFNSTLWLVEKKVKRQNETKRFCFVLKLWPPRQGQGQWKWYKMAGTTKCGWKVCVLCPTIGFLPCKLGDLEDRRMDGCTWLITLIHIILTWIYAMCYVQPALYHPYGSKATTAATKTGSLFEMACQHSTVNTALYGTIWSDISLSLSLCIPTYLPN